MSCFRAADDELSRNAEIAFIARVVAVEESAFNPHPRVCQEKYAAGPECGGRLSTLEVTRALRNREPGPVKVLTEDSCVCLGLRWRVGESYVVVAKANDSGLAADLIALGGCSGTTALSEPGAAALAEKLARPR